MSATSMFNRIRASLEALIRCHTKQAGIAESKLLKRWRFGQEEVKEKNGLKSNAPKSKGPIPSDRPKTASMVFDVSDYICLVCRRHYPKAGGWRDHISSKHPEQEETIRKNRCDECKLLFAKPY